MATSDPTTKQPNDLLPTAEDRLAAAAAGALALRRLGAYRAARTAAKEYGADVSLLPKPPQYAEIDAAYAELMRSVMQEVPQTPAAELGYLALIGSILADRITPHDGPVMCHDEDLCCALQMLNLIRHVANDRDIAEAVSEERAKHAALPR